MIINDDNLKSGRVFGNLIKLSPEHLRLIEAWNYQRNFIHDKTPDTTPQTDARLPPVQCVASTQESD